jgi:hypothetical protein
MFWVGSFMAFWSRMLPVRRGRGSATCSTIAAELDQSRSPQICLHCQDGEGVTDLANFAVVAMNAPQEKQPDPPPATQPADPVPSRPREIGGRDGPEPTRYGDWEKAGRCIDF